MTHTHTTRHARGATGRAHTFSGVFIGRKRIEHAKNQAIRYYYNKVQAHYKCRFSSMKTAKNGTCLQIPFSFFSRTHIRKSENVTLNVTLNFQKE